MALEGMYMTRDGYKKSRKEEATNMSILLGGKKTPFGKYLDPDDIYIG